MTVATNRDWVNIAGPTDFTTVTNAATIGPGNDGVTSNPDGLGHPVGLHVRSSALVGTLINQTGAVISATEGLPGGFHSSTPSATATAVVVDGTVGTLSNHGTIFASALAHDTGSSAVAAASAQGIRFNVPGAVENSGDISGHAQASAFGATIADATASAFGVMQNINAANGAASVDNDGKIEATAFALASATARQALLVAGAVGIDQSFTGGTASASVINGLHGEIGGYAQGSAFGSDAVARVNANGIAQTIGPGVGTATVDNDGKIDATALALASATVREASVIVGAVGIGQFAKVAEGPTALVVNGPHGDVGAYARGSAFGVTSAQEFVNAAGVSQSGLATVENEGTIEATAFGFASATAGGGPVSVFANASAKGVEQVSNNPGAAAATVSNGVHGDIGAYAQASAFGVNNAQAQAVATGVSQFAADGTSGAASVDNGGSIAGTGMAFASATAGLAVANGGVFGISQNIVNVSTASASVINGLHGDIGAYAKDSAFGTLARALPLAAGINQRIVATSGVATVDNDGWIGGTALALASATAGQALARANAFGIRQSISALIPAAMVKNSGTVKAFANATALGFNPVAIAHAAAVSVTAFTGGTGTLEVEIDNSGLIKAEAMAKATGASAPTAAATATGIFVQSDFALDGSIINSGSVIAVAMASGPANSAQAFGILDPAAVNNGQLLNTGLIRAYARGSRANAFGIVISDNNAPAGTSADLATVTNDGGTIWAGKSTDGGKTVQQGGAIDTNRAPNAVLIELQGSQKAGHIFGYISLSDDDAIEVTNGKTFFDGTINGPVGSTLDIFDGGKLVLCQEGWQSACDPNGWGNANYNPENGTNGPSMVNIDTFNVGSDGTIAFQLTPQSAPGWYPQVFANTANLGGTLEAEYLPGFYRNSTLYDNVIQASAGTGTFASVKDNSVLLKTKAMYDGFNVDLSVKRTPFNKVSGLTKNEKAVGGGIENVYGKLPGPGTNPAGTSNFAKMVAKLFTIDSAQALRLVYDQLTGSQYAQLLQSVLWSGRPFDQAITDRMDCTVNRILGKAPTPGVSWGTGCFAPKQWKAWVRAWGGWNNNDGDVNAPGYNENQFGVWGGGDYAFDTAWFLGVAGGYFQSHSMDFDNFGGVNGGSASYDGGQFAVYGGWDIDTWYNRDIVSFGWYSADVHRDIAIQSPPVDPSSSPDANVVSWYNETGRRFAVGTNSLVTPFIGVNVAHAELDGVTESDPGHSGAALRVSGSSGNSVSTLVGLRYNGAWGAWRPQLAVGWQHEYDDTFQTVNASFADAPSGSNFRVVGTDLGRDAVVVDAGMTYQINPSSDFSVRYDGTWLDRYDGQSVMGRFDWKFGGAVAHAPAPAYEPLKLGG